MNIKAKITSTFLFLLLLITSFAYAGAEDFSTYTETDNCSCVTVTSSRITVASIDRNNTSIVYKDFGDGYFANDFRHYVDIQPTGSTSGGFVTVWGMQNDTYGSAPTDMKTNQTNSGDALFVRMFETSGNYELKIFETDGGTNYSSSGYNMSVSTTYYLDIYRDESVGTYGTIYVDVYGSASNRSSGSSVLSNLSLALHTSKKDFQWLFGMSSHNTSTSETISGYSENLRIQTELTALVSISTTVTAEISTPFKIVALVSPTATVAVDGIETKYKKIGSGDHNNSLSFPPQIGICMDGLYVYGFFVASLSSTPQVAYASKDDLYFGTSHDVPRVGAASDGYNTAYSCGYRLTYGSYVAMSLGTSNDLSISYKDDDSLNSSQYMGSSIWEDLAITDIDNYPSPTIDNSDYVWIMGRNGTSPNYTMEIVRASQPFNVSNWDTPFLLRTIGADDTIGQPIPFGNDDLLATYSDALVAHEKYWVESTDLFGGEQTIYSDLRSWFSFRTVPTRNDKTYTIVRSGTDSKLYYGVRTSGSAGTYGSFTLVDDDTELADNNGFCMTANSGEDEEAYLSYYDTSGNIVWRTLSSGGVSGKTTIVSSPSQKNYKLDCPLYEPDFIPVAYHVTDNDNILIGIIDITPSQASTGDLLVANLAAPKQGTFGTSSHAVSDGDITLYTWAGRDFRYWGRLRNTSTNTWVNSAEVITERFWDLHNRPYLIDDSSAFAYFAYGGRDGGGTTTYLTVLKSTVAVSSMTGVDKDTDWTDISPTNQLGEYKKLIVDNDGVVFLIFDKHQADPLVTQIMEYRDGEWSTPVTLLSVPGLVDLNYSVATLGLEGSDQSISLLFTIKDASLQPEIEAGSVVNNDVSWAKIEDQEDGTFKAYRANTTELTLPMTLVNRDLVYSGETAGGLMGITTRINSTAYSTNDMIFPITPDNHIYRATNDGTTGASPPTYSQDHNTTTVDSGVTWEEFGIVGDDWVRLRGGLTMLDATTPALTILKTDTSDPYPINTLDFVKWDATNWITVEVENANFPDHIATKLHSGSEGLFLTSQSLFSGISDVVYYLSSDGGTTWSGAERIVASPYDSYNTSMSERTTLLQNIVYHDRIHRGHSEVYASTLQIGKGGGGNPFNPWNPFSKIEYRFTEARYEAYPYSFTFSSN